jgi:cytidylate kinase
LRVLSGSLAGWGDALTLSFDLVVFLYVPMEVRLTGSSQANGQARRTLVRSLRRPHHE